MSEITRAALRSRDRTPGLQNDPGLRGAQSDQGEPASLGHDPEAFKFLEKLARELSTGTVELPCFPQVVVKIRLALSDSRSSADSITTLIGTEPRLAAKLLQLANSAALNSSGHKIVDLKTAVARIGHGLVQ